MRWNPIIKIFSQHWKALRTRMKEDKPEVPKITKGMLPTKWSEAFLDFLLGMYQDRVLKYLMQPPPTLPTSHTLLNIVLLKGSLLLWNLMTLPIIGMTTKQSISFLKIQRGGPSM